MNNCGEGGPFPISQDARHPVHSAGQRRQHAFQSIAKLSVVFIILILGVQGCSSFQNYSRISAPARADISRGNFQQALEVFPEKSAKGKNEVLIRLERGMIFQEMGWYEQSTQEFEQADKLIRNYEEKAVISAGKTASQAGTLLVNEQVMPYEGKDFEKILLHTFDAMNYLMTGNLTDARVEVRRAYEQQEVLSQKHEKEMEKAKEEGNTQVWQRSFEQADRQGYDRIRSKASSVYSVYHNAFASYLSSLVYELNGEPDEAYIDLKKALIASPDSECIQKDLVRLARKLNYRDEVDQWESRFGPGEKEQKGSIDVFLVFSHGLAPYKQAITFPIPIRRGFVSASLPVYQFTPSNIAGGEIEYDGRRVQSSVVFDTDAVASRNFMDELPIMLAKQVARSYLKAEATSSLGRNQGDWGAVLGTLLSLITEQADLRTWSSLPKQIQVARAFVPTSTKELTVRVLPAGTGTSVTIPPGTSHLMVLCRATESGLTIQTKSFYKGGKL
jgi:hypothetical protein